MTTGGRLGADGYRLILPEGWVRLNVRDDVQATVDDVLGQISFDTLPRDERPKRRAAIEGRVRFAIERAKKMDAYAIYLPLHGMHGLAIPASFLVGAATEFADAGPEDEVLDELLKTPGAQRALLDGSDAVRTEAATVTVDEPSGEDFAGRQVVYTVRVPAASEWLIVVYDVLTADKRDAEYDAFVDALVALFDGIMTTFRWTFDQQ